MRFDLSKGFPSDNQEVASKVNYCGASLVFKR